LSEPAPRIFTPCFILVKAPDSNKCSIVIGCYGFKIPLSIKLAILARLIYSSYNPLLNLLDLNPLLGSLLTNEL
jgi:hypothetical protein